MLLDSDSHLVHQSKGSIRTMKGPVKMVKRARGGCRVEDSVKFAPGQESERAAQAAEMATEPGEPALNKLAKFSPTTL